MLLKTKHALEWIIFSFLGVIMLISAGLCYYQYTYAKEVYRNVSVAGIDISGKTKEQVSFLLQKKYSAVMDKEVTFKATDKEIKTKVSDTGLTLDIDKITDESFAVGRNNNFFTQAKLSLFTLWKKTEIPVESKIDQDKYKNFTQIAIAQLNSEPKNASLSIEAGEIKEVPETTGFVVNTDNLTEKILLLSGDDAENVITLDGSEKAPEIRVADFEPAKQYARSILDKKFRFSYENKVYTPSKVEIGLWVTFTNKDNKYTASLNESNVEAYLNRIAKDFEIIKKDKRINAATNAVIEEGQAGKLLDKNAAVTAIKNQLKSPADVQVALATYDVTPGEVKIFPAEGLVAGRFEGRYLDIDLATQRLCEIEGQNILDCYTISSGKPGMATPTGTYTISEKNPRHWSSKYSMWLPYWQRFIDEGYGIHELPETNTWKETDEHLGTPVSHGCVRLGVGPAEAVYNWTSVGTPIYIHK